MSSELVKKLEKLNARYEEGLEFLWKDIGNNQENQRIIKQEHSKHCEKQQMKGMNLRELVNDKDNFAAPEEAEKLFVQVGYELKMKEPFYQLTEEQQNRLERLRRKRQFVVSPCIYDSWAIEQEKLGEEEAE